MPAKFEPRDHSALKGAAAAVLTGAVTLSLWLLVTSGPLDPSAARAAAWLSLWSLPFWFFGVLFVGMPCWWLMERMGLISPIAAALGGMVVVGTALCLILQFFGSPIEPRLRWIVCGAVAGAAAGFAMQRAAYRRIG